MNEERYVCSTEIGWSVLEEGFTLSRSDQDNIIRILGRTLQRGEEKDISIVLNGTSYKEIIKNLNNPKTKRKRDAYQIRYTRNGELSKALQSSFINAYQYMNKKRKQREEGDRSIIRLPKEQKEYLTMYTTEIEDTYIMETIVAEDIESLRKAVEGQEERVWETEFNYDVTDHNAGIMETERILKIRKMNKKIGDDLKRLYAYRCQSCGKSIGEEYGAPIVEAHHIDYFVSSLNNDANNQLILCPNHHSITHASNPTFDRKKMMYIYSNGITQKLMLNKHLY